MPALLSTLGGVIRVDNIIISNGSRRIVIYRKNINGWGVSPWSGLPLYLLKAQILEDLSDSKV
jgi:hypothetical protein